MKRKGWMKTGRRFWQEIFFIIPVSVFLIHMFIGYPEIFKDWLGIATIGFHLILLFSLISQFFWRRTALSFILILCVGLYSMFWIFASLFMLIKNSDKVIPTIIFSVSLFSLFPAITMTVKKMVPR